MSKDKISETDWFDYGVLATHTHKLPEYSKGEVIVCSKPLPKDKGGIRVMAEDHAIYLVEPEQLTPVYDEAGNLKRTRRGELVNSTKDYWKEELNKRTV